MTRAPGVGVDVELASPYLNVGDLEVDVLAPQETSTLRGLDSVGRRCGLLAYWTRKEAALKATGDGLGELRRLMVPPDAPPKMLAWPDRSELRRV